MQKKSYLLIFSFLLSFKHIHVEGTILFSFFSFHIHSLKISMFLSFPQNIFSKDINILLSFFPLSVFFKDMDVPFFSFKHILQRYRCCFSLILSFSYKVFSKDIQTYALKISMFFFPFHMFPNDFLFLFLLSVLSRYMFFSFHSTYFLKKISMFLGITFTFIPLGYLFLYLMVCCLQEVTK